MTWGEAERAGALLRFVDMNFRGAESEADYAGRFPGAMVSVRGLSLRDIYLVIARMPQV